MLATWPTGTYRRAMNTDEFDTFGYLLGDAARVLRSRFDAYARTVGVTRQQWMVLLALMRQERSEEHTSELQSLMRISYAVFCLKKKTQIKTNNTNCTISSNKIKRYTT